ncbi:uncharacterized protein LOC125049038 isoform X2 [Pieris napi]|uniref:uncharacterized protein LOC125049038 isoform X2 n=1 Tax=Pieris napi TaxID=78633 RepID=UPI001FB9D303|nr:uncharacterized protein LOC125049038 isoform X2 [Pieris napi]
MEEQNIVNIRTNNRNMLQLNRQIHRDEINDVRRSVISRYTTEDVLDIIKKLKTKTSITSKELNQLKNALMNEPHNIELVLGLHGAIRGIVGELTGTDIKKQCAAAGCLCNLSMGDSKACFTICRATGTYLVAAVDNMATELAVTCVWTLGNLAASSMKTCDMLISQGALSKVIDIHPNNELQDACLYALKHFVYQLGDKLKLVDSEALDQTWKVNRRERLKQQEQKIWEEFVQEQDVVTNICKDDPYQFIEQLSEEKIKELLDIELEKMKKERLEEEIQAREVSPKKDEQGAPQQNDNHHVVFINESDRENESFHIFDDEKDVSGVSGPEDELLNDSMSPPCTVRERLSPSPGSRYPSPDKDSSTKSSENVTSMIESSIYCAKVKELRTKLAAQLDEMTIVLERQNILNIDPADLPKMMRRSVEFTSRFNRINIYQLQRQLQDIKRNDSQAMPFAKHTQFQTQLVRIVSLHQNALHSLQVFMKSFPQTLCIRESGVALRSLACMMHEVTNVCSALTAPPALVAANRLYNDGLPSANDKLLNAVEDYTIRMTEYLNSTDNTSMSYSRRSKKSRRGRKSIGSCSKSGKSFGDTEGQLSMYSLDTLRHPSTVKASSSKLNSGSRRPLMRDPQAGAPKPKRKIDKDLDVPTLVETVAPCASSHISRDPSPNLKDLTKGKESPRSPKKVAKRLKKEKTPRRSSKSPKRSITKSTGKQSVILDKQLDSKETHEPPKVPMLIQLQETETPKKEVETPKKETEMIKKDTATLTKVNESQRRGMTTPKKETPRKISTPRSDLTVTKKQVTPRKEINRRNTPRLENVTKEEPIPPEKLRTSRTPRTMNMGGGEKELEEEIKDTSKRDEIRDTPRKEGSKGTARKGETRDTPRKEDADRDIRASTVGGCEVMTLLRQLCGGDSPGTRIERISGAKNGQLICMSSGSPRQPSTPQLLKILEETIKKKPPRTTSGVPASEVALAARSLERCRMALCVDENAAERLFSYRTAFMQHMLASPLYANSAVGKPWEVIGKVSERILDELLVMCAKEMELQPIVKEIYRNETS